MESSAINSLLGVEPEVERLVGEGRARQFLGFGRRELLVELVAGGAFLAVASLMAALLPWHRPLTPVGLALVLLVGVAACSAPFEVGDGWAVPSQILFVPALFVLPAALTPLVAVLWLVAVRVIESAQGKLHWSRTINCFADSWYAVGPALVLAVSAPGPPEWSKWPIYVGALCAQFAVEAACGTARAWAQTGIAPRMQFNTLGWSFAWAVDLMLAPIGLLAAFEAASRPELLLLLLPLVGLFGLFARERTARLDNALELSSAYRGTAVLLGDVIEADDAYTGDHSRGVVELSVAVADQMRLSPAQRRRIEFGALLHDIGKISVPKEILNKPGPLNDDEWKVMHRHTIDGETMLRQVGGRLADVGAVVRSSHERFDGSGYPDGLAGEAIPLEARVISCCDAYSAMTTDRPYRKAMPAEEAIAELHACAGTQFDPEVVEALVNVVLEK